MKLMHSNRQLRLLIIDHPRPCLGLRRLAPPLPSLTGPRFVCRTGSRSPTPPRAFACSSASHCRRMSPANATPLGVTNAAWREATLASGCELTLRREALHLPFFPYRLRQPDRPRPLADRARRLDHPPASARAVAVEPLWLESRADLLHEGKGLVVQRSLEGRVARAARNLHLHTVDSRRRVMSGQVK